MKKLQFILLITIVKIIFLSSYAFAYIDPGTGGIIGSSLWPLAVAFTSSVVAFLVKYFWKPIKKVLLDLINR